MEHIHIKEQEQGWTRLVCVGVCGWLTLQGRSTDLFKMHTDPLLLFFGGSLKRLQL